MISSVRTPKTKQELVSALQKLRNPEIEIVEALSAEDRKEVMKRFDGEIRRGAVSVILIREKSR